MAEPADESRRRDVLAMLAPGTMMRDGLERILRARRGTLIVIGSTPLVQSLCSGGFVIDSPSTGQRIAELADGRFAQFDFRAVQRHGRDAGIRLGGDRRFLATAGQKCRSYTGRYRGPAELTSVHGTPLIVFSANTK